MEFVVETKFSKVRMVKTIGMHVGDKILETAGVHVAVENAKEFYAENVASTVNNLWDSVFGRRRLSELAASGAVADPSELRNLTRWQLEAVASGQHVLAGPQRFSAFTRSQSQLHDAILRRRVARSLLGSSASFGAAAADVLQAYTAATAGAGSPLAVLSDPTSWAAFSAYVMQQPSVQCLTGCASSPDGVGCIEALSTANGEWAAAVSVAHQAALLAASGPAPRAANSAQCAAALDSLLAVDAAPQYARCLLSCFPATGPGVGRYECLNGCSVKLFGAVIGIGGAAAQPTALEGMRSAVLIIQRLCNTTDAAAPTTAPDVPDSLSASSRVCAAPAATARRRALADGEFGTRVGLAGALTSRSPSHNDAAAPRAPQPSAPRPTTPPRKMRVLTAGSHRRLTGDSSSAGAAAAGAVYPGSVVVLSGRFGTDEDVTVEFARGGTVMNGTVVTKTAAGVGVIVPPELPLRVASADFTVTLTSQSAGSTNTTMNIVRLPADVRRVLRNQSETGELCSIALVNYASEYEAMKGLATGASAYIEKLLQSNLTMAELFVAMKVFHGVVAARQEMLESTALLFTRLIYDEQLCQHTGFTLSMVDLINGYTTADDPVSVTSDPLSALDDLVTGDNGHDLLYSPPAPPPSPPLPPPPPESPANECSTWCESAYRTCLIWGSTGGPRHPRPPPARLHVRPSLRTAETKGRAWWRASTRSRPARVRSALCAPTAAQCPRRRRRRRPWHARPRARPSLRTARIWGRARRTASRRSQAAPARSAPCAPSAAACPRRRRRRPPSTAATRARASSPCAPGMGLVTWRADAKSITALVRLAHSARLGAFCRHHHRQVAFAALPVPPSSPCASSMALARLAAYLRSPLAPVLSARCAASAAPCSPRHRHLLAKATAATRARGSSAPAYGTALERRHAVASWTVALVRSARYAHPGARFRRRRHRAGLAAMSVSPSSPCAPCMGLARRAAYLRSPLALVHLARCAPSAVPCSPRHRRRRAAGA